MTNGRHIIHAYSRAIVMAVLQDDGRTVGRNVKESYY